MTKTTACKNNRQVCCEPAVFAMNTGDSLSLNVFDLPFGVPSTTILTTTRLEYIIKLIMEIAFAINLDFMNGGILHPYIQTQTSVAPSYQG